MSVCTDVDLPPGTFHLYRRLEDDGEELLMPDPMPSSDPNDPLNWSTWRKAVNYSQVIAVTVIIFTALSIQVVFWQQMTVDMNLTFAQLNNAVSTNNAGLAMGCLLFIPFTRKYGRRSTYVLSTLVMALTSFWSAKMTTEAELYLTNLFYGLAGATNEAIVQMTIADLFFVYHRGTMNALYMTAVITGSFLTSIIAGVQADSQEWRWSYWTLGIVTTVVFLIFLFTYEETKYVPTLAGVAAVNTPAESARPATVREALNDPNMKHPTVHKSELERTSFQLRPKIDVTIPLSTWSKRLQWTTKTSESLWRLSYPPIIVLFTFPHVMFTALQYASGVVWLTILASVVSIVFSAPPYNFSTTGIGLMSLGPFVGNMIGSIYGGVLGDWAVKFFSRRNRGYYEPEFRLYLLHLPAVALCGGLIMFGVTAEKAMHWIYPSVGGAIFGFGLGAVGDASLTLIIDTYRELTGEAFVGIAFMRNAVSIGIPFAITPWIERNGLTNMFVTCGLLSLFITLLIIPMSIYGKHIRTKLGPRYYDIVKKEGAHRHRTHESQQ